MNRTHVNSKLEATRRAIQHEFLKLLTQSGFTFRQGAKEPRGLQAKVLEAVNKMYHGRTRLKTNRQQVSDWVAKVRNNSYRTTSVRQDYSQSSQNRRKIFENEQGRIRQGIREGDLKSSELVSIYSDKEKKQIFFNFEDEILSSVVLTHLGQIRLEQFK